MSRRPRYAAFGLVLLAVLLLLSLPSKAGTRIKLVIGSLFLPLFGLSASVQTVADQAIDRIVPRRVLLERIEQLQRENQQLRLKAAQGDEALAENNRLRQLAGWQQQAPWRLRPARVVGRDTSNWWRTLQIDVGSRDGVKPDSSALCAGGLVGRVTEVGYTISRVVLVGDPKCRVAVVIRETGEHGIISASSAGVLDHRLVDLTHLPRNVSLRAGQTVYTSGLGGLYPPGIPVGTVVDSRSVAYGLYTEARVKLAADSSRLREVMVLMP